MQIKDKQFRNRSNWKNHSINWGDIMATVIKVTSRVLTPEEQEARKKRIEAILQEMLLEIENREDPETIN
jgi:hypothetical protein